MFNLFGKKNTEQAQQEGKTAEFKIEGMHCSSCAMSIDGELEDIEGVSEASTNYASATTVVRFDPDKVSEETMKKTVEEIGYKAARKN